VLYVFGKVLLAGGLTFVLFSPKPELILGGACAGVVIGLGLIVLMVGLMGRVERMCAERPEVAWSSPEAEVPARPGGWIFRLVALGGVLLPILLAAGAFAHYLAWQQARDDEVRKASSSAYFFPARDTFYDHLRAGRLDEAYASTTENFRNRISRERFDELARKYAAYVNRPDHQRGASGAGSSSGSEYLTQYEYTEVEKGKIVQVTLTIRRDQDSIFLRTPPPVKVDDFNVEEKAVPQQPGPGFGQPLGPGRRRLTSALLAGICFCDEPTAAPDRPDLPPVRNVNSNPGRRLADGGVRLRHKYARMRPNKSAPADRPRVRRLRSGVVRRSLRDLHE
jgi:hypothetical protein